MIHGEYCNVHAAKKHLDVSRTNIAFAHTHRIGQYHEADIAAFNIGWGGDKEEKVFGYASRLQKSNWRNGMAIVYLDTEGYFHLNQLVFINNSFYW